MTTLDKATVGRLLREAKANNKADVIHFDDALAGFGLRLRRTVDGGVLGSFVVQYRQGRQQRRMKIGSIEKLSVEQARSKAKKKLAEVELGNDPQAERKGERLRTAIRFADVAEQYLAAKAKVLRPGSYRVTKLYLNGEAYFGSVHARPISEIGFADIGQCLTRIEAEHSAHTAAAARRAASAFFVWSMRKGFCGASPSNPVANTETPATNKARERVLSDQELAAIWKACGDDQYGRIIRLLALTGCRRAEIGGLRWAEIDFGERKMTLPAERTKNKHQHDVPLSSTALEIIRGVPRRLHRDHLFGDGKNGFADWNRAKGLLDERCGVLNWRPHDLRRTAATRLADLGTPPHIIEALLDHRTGSRAGVAAIYNKSRYWPELRDAVTKWEQYLKDPIAAGLRARAERA
jgi:integrase